MSAQATLRIATTESGPTISRHLFGHFAEHLGRCIYDGLWVGPDSPVPNVRGWRSDLVGALRAIKIPNLRWPGGCYADDYHWRDGIGPRQQRPRRVNAHWGGVVESNEVGTHEFLDLCEQLDCEPYLAANVGSGTVREMREWVEYCNASAGSLADERVANGRKEPWHIRLWGVGNENWGCGGNMRVEYYADEYRRYATYVRPHSDTPVLRMGCGPRNDDYHWTEVMMRECGQPIFGDRMLAGLSLHYYTVPGDWDNKQQATPFDTHGWNEVMARGWLMEDYVRGHSAVMDRFDPKMETALVVDEWGSWYAQEPGTHPGFLYQQQTVRDGVLAALNLNIFIGHCDRLRFANLAQVVNVLQAVALTEPDGGRLVLTPTWDVFALYAVHHEATRLPLEIETAEIPHSDGAYPQVSAAASRAANGEINVTVTNTDSEQPVEVTLALSGLTAKNVKAQIVASPELTACNTFDQPRVITTRDLSGVSLSGEQVTLTLPAASIVSLNFS